MKQVFNDREELLIAIYLDICNFYDTNYEFRSYLENNSPNKVQYFTDLELIAMVIFGSLMHNDNKKRIYKYIRAHYRAYFPTLPSYSRFVKRLNNLHEAIFHLLNYFMNYAEHSSGAYYIIDSFPVMVAKAHHTLKSKWANGVVKKGYKSSKDLWLYGVNVHMIVDASNNHKLPMPIYTTIDTANVFDLNVAKQMLPQLENLNVSGDLAYSDTVFIDELKDQHSIVLGVPIKAKKGKLLSLMEQVSNSFFSSLRQPIEILFGITDRFSKIQDAHLVRSYSGLLFHISLNFVAFFIDYFCFNINC